MVHAPRLEAGPDGHGRRRPPLGAASGTLDGTRLRVGAFAWAVVLGGSCLAAAAWTSFVLLVAPTSRRPPGWETDLLRSVVLGVLGVAVASYGVYLAFAGGVRLGSTRLTVTLGAPGRRAVVDARDVKWTPGQRYVGRRLVAVDPATGRSVNVPIWMLRRNDREVLFAWLDEKFDSAAGREPGGASVGS